MISIRMRKICGESNCKLVVEYIFRAALNDKFSIRIEKGSCSSNSQKIILNYQKIVKRYH